MLSRLLREPLAHFLVIGLLLFLVFKVIGGDRSSEDREIVVSEGVVAGLVQQFSGVWQRPPTAQELQGLVDNWIRDEVLYREGLELGLDRDDQVVRRRVRQKVDVLAEESQPSQPATDAELNAWLQKYADRYALPPVLSFEQAMVDPTRHRDAEKAASDLHRRLQGGADPQEVSDSRLLPTRVAGQPEDLVARDFGEEFIVALRKLPAGNSWQGPVRSGYGLHFVKINSRVPGRAPTLEEVRDDVARDVEQDRRERAANAFYVEARGNYDVRIEAGPSSKASAAAASK